VPALVLTADDRWDLHVGATGSTWPAWLCPRDLLATALNADHVTNSGHVIGLDQPAVVVDAIRSVVGSAQRGG